jgi:hypothetical protein
MSQAWFEVQVLKYIYFEFMCSSILQIFTDAEIIIIIIIIILWKTQKN